MKKNLCHLRNLWDKKNRSKISQDESAGEAAISPNVKKDFRGVMCPMNFVKTKIALTPMQNGQILEILLDDGALKQLGEPGVYELLEERSNRFLSRLEKIVEGKGIQVNHVGTMFTMFFNDQPVHNFISLCHTDEILDYVLKSIEESIE